MARCIQFAAGMHDYKIVKKTWQTVDHARYQVLDHSTEAAVCIKCGHTVNPWEKSKEDTPCVSK